MPSVDELFVRLLSDRQARAEFAERPREVLRAAGADEAVIGSVPERLDPRSIDLAAVETAAKLRQEGISVDDLATSAPSRVADIVQRLRNDLVAHSSDEIASSTVSPTVATVTPIVILISPVVTTAGMGHHREAASDLSITRGGGGLTLHGPSGLSVTGLTVDDVAAVIKRVMR
jgi:hypothetical protein